MLGKMVLIGDMRLSLAMSQAMEKEIGQKNRIVFCDILERYKKEDIKIQQIQGVEIQKTDLCLLLLPRYYGCAAEENRKLDYRKELLKKYKNVIKQYGEINLLDYPYEDVEWMRAENLFEGYGKPELKPLRIILGASNYCSGNILFKGILDGHPDVLEMRDTILGRNLCSFCVRLSMEPSCKILSTLWELYEEIEHSGFPDQEKFGSC